MKNYQEWYRNIRSRLTSRPILLFLLRSFNRLMTVAMPLVYLILLVTTYLQLGLGQQVGVYVLIPASGFVALSLFRKKINHLRPYETWDICPLLDKDSSGRSMPSRHVFSQLTDENFKGQVEFKDVTFRYAANSEAVIEHVSFKAETGQTVAFIGSIGSGKSTLVNLIPRFYDVSAGEILVDGVNVQDYDFSATAHAGQRVAIVGPTGAGKTTIVNLLMKFYEIDKGSIRIDGVDTKAMTRSEVHDAFSMVLQDTWLFEGTIRDNLIYNQIGISDERMMEASKAVGIHHFIMTLPDGYDTILDDTVTLSVGQKQLLTIARALLKDAPLLILDEATSSVDTRTEELIQKAMDRLMEGRTSFVIAHRLSTIRNADLILVMKDGNIIEQGNYEELMV
ncbi:multidrug resistance protein 3 [Streptococcus pneumoniae]|nr:multidrug resistance protein 3 [Streptococcus pneumoniae]